MAHEINNPLTYIMGNAELVQLNVDEVLAREPLTPEGREMLVDAKRRQAQALAGLDQIRRIVDGLRVVSKGTRASAPRPIGVDAVVATMLDLTRSHVPSHVEVLRDLASTKPVLLHEGELGQVVLNLSLNALQATQPQASGELRIATRDTEGGVRIEIEDTGPGIPAEVQQVLFTPFATGRTDGTGLGPSICQTIVAGCGGRITWQSAPTGTRFRVDLPATAPA